MTHTISTASITRESAQALVLEARKAGTKIGIELAIAVTDSGGHLTAFERSERCPFLTANVAIDKAWTAASFGLSTQTWNGVVKDSKVSQLAHQARLVTVGGGIPIKLNGQIVGGLGISGGNADQDHEAAVIALRALGFDVTE